MNLHIGVVHWAFPPTIGGVEMHLLTVGAEMVQQGASVTVLTGSIEGEPETSTVRGMTVIRRDELVPEYLDALYERAGASEAHDRFYAQTRRAVEAFVDTYDVHVIQAHNLHMDFLAISQALVDVCHERAIPAYLVLHNPIFIDRMDSPTIRSGSSRILTDVAWDRLVAVSDYIYQVLRKKMPQIPDRKWKVIKHGINTDTFQPVTPRERDELKAKYGFEGRSVILHTGRFLPWKGILPAIKAMPLVVQDVPDALMVMPGRGERVYRDEEELAEYDRQIDRYIEQHDLETYVHIQTYDREDIPRLTALADVVIYTTIGEEPFGLVPVEGMASGNPVVVTQSGGMVESVVDGQTGFIIPKDEQVLPQALAERITQLLKNPDLRAEMGARGRQRVEAHFDRSRMARDYIEFSRQLLAEIGR